MSKSKSAEKFNTPRHPYNKNPIFVNFYTETDRSTRLFFLDLLFKNI